MAKALQEIDKLLPYMTEQIETINDIVSDLIDIANLPSNSGQMKDLLTACARCIRSRTDNYKAENLKIKNLIKEESDKMDIASSSKIDISSSSSEEMIDLKKIEESFSFRPHSDKTMFKEKKVILEAPIPLNFIETQNLLMRELYNLKDNDNRYIDFSGIYPRINYLQGSSPQEIRYWFDFGAINSIYLTSPNFHEISQLPFWIGEGIKDCYLKNPTITPNDILVLKFLSAGPDFYEDQRYPSYHFMQIGKSESFSISFKTQKGEFQRFCQNDIHYRRAIGIRTVLQGMEASFKRGFRTYSGKNRFSSVMISSAKTTPEAAANFMRFKINLLDTGTIKSSPQAQNKICQYRQHKRGICPSCSPQKDKEEDKGVHLASSGDDD